ncbi:MAG: carbohydrate-binding domain-containing protein [Oscillospiraceae bacterium]
MKSSLRALAALCSIAISFNTGCTPGTASSTDSSGEESGSVPVTDTVTSDAVSSSDMKTVSSKDLTPATQSGSDITFSEDGAAITAGGSVSGNVVTITKSGTYSVSGSCSDGQLVIDCGKDDDVSLILNGLELTCSNAPAILCEKADKLVITLAGDSVNTLSDGAGYNDETAEDTGAALFSRDTLVINGTGTLNVNSVFRDGIRSKDGLKLCGGIINVTSAEDGIVGKDYLLAAAGTVTVNSGLDALKSTNSTDTDKGYVSVTGGNYKLVCGNDGIQAETALNISGGDIEIISGGGSSTVEYTSSDNGGGGRWGRFSVDGAFDFGSMTAEDGSTSDSMKGLKSGTGIIITGGTINADCADDAIHSGGGITIEGGNFTLSSGDDGIHSDTTLTITSGEINILTSYEGLEANAVELNGGTICLTAYDDGINASGDTGSDSYISVSGGSITVNANGDGIDSNGTVCMSGGTLVVFGPTNNGNAALDYDRSFAMSGGTLVALGSQGMAQAPSTLSQPCLSVYGNAAAGSTIEVRDAEGSVIISTTTPKAAQSLIFSTGEFVSGQTYSIYADDQLITQVTATDGVSGDGANGNGGNWNHDGDAPWGGGAKPGKGGMNGGFGRSDSSTDSAPQLPDGETGFTRPEKPQGQSPDVDLPSLPGGTDNTTAA